MKPIDLVNLGPLMERSAGSPEIMIGLIDGPVVSDHPDLVDARMSQLHEGPCSTEIRAENSARIHGTFVAGVLSARRGSSAPAICPKCTLLPYPIFGEPLAADGGVPSATPEELGDAIVACVKAGSRILNLSLALAHPSSRREKVLEEALNYAVQQGSIVIAAAGNQGTIGSSAITRHPSVITVVACDLLGRPLSASNLSGSIGRHGLSAPGDHITSLGHDGDTIRLSGTSFAVPFVTGAAALLWSVFPSSTAFEISAAMRQSNRTRRTSVVPPLLNAAAAYEVMAMSLSRRVSA